MDGHAHLSDVASPWRLAAANDCSVSDHCPIHLCHQACAAFRNGFEALLPGIFGRIWNLKSSHDRFDLAVDFLQGGCISEFGMADSNVHATRSFFPTNRIKSLLRICETV